MSIRHLTVIMFCACRLTLACVFYFVLENNTTSVCCRCSCIIFAIGTGDSGASARCWVVRLVFTTKIISSGVSTDISDDFFDDDMSENATLEVPDGNSALSFSSSHELTAVAPSYLWYSCTLLYLGMCC